MVSGHDVLIVRFLSYFTYISIFESVATLDHNPQVLMGYSGYR